MLFCFQHPLKSFAPRLLCRWDPSAEPSAEVGFETRVVHWVLVNMSSASEGSPTRGIVRPGCPGHLRSGALRVRSDEAVTELGWGRSLGVSVGHESLPAAHSVGRCGE